ncbi:YHS domain-containing (seleno)protein [Polaribacter tangerinus]|uniref:YHS domain-containing (seleno)protein n=1 Tax=Polaribacter tangerinus TaxID=1920034 RepID=UPI000B4B6973|nr:YHS domain-containing (seleno)protein [Polaribacter tangerinus]
MKQLLFLLFFCNISLVGQEYNLEKGFIANGYDVVSYFTDGKPKEGNNSFLTSYNGVKLKFSSEKNLKLFKENPKKYFPQCGGFCAYAIATRSERKEINPTTFEIRDGKLYLFYNKWFFNKLESWLDEKPDLLKIKATEN